MEKFVLYMDDTGFNAHEKASKTLQQEEGTFVGVLVSKEQEAWLDMLIGDLCDNLRKKFNTTEFHFTDLYFRKKPFENIQFDETIEILQTFAETFQLLELQIFVHSFVEKGDDMDKLLNQGVDAVLEQMKIKPSGKARAMILAYMKAKKSVQTEGDIIEKIVCDEGLRKNGTNITIPTDSCTIEFKSSKECKMLQFADFAAWIVTRAKNILDKISVNKEIKDTDRQVLEVYEMLTDNFVGLKTFALNDENIGNFSYDQLFDDEDENNE